jgi:MFS family permease
MQSFRGWRVLGLTVLTQALQAGLLIYGFGVIILPFAAEFAVSRETLMLASTFLSLATNLLSPVVGTLIDRRSIRPLMLCGVVALACGFLLLSQVQAMWQVLAIFALVLPVGNLLLGQLSSTTLMTRWFARLRGRAMGISAVGTSIGGLVIPPLLATVIASQGWRTAFLLVAAAALVLLIVPIALIVIDRPADVGQRPDGASADAPGGEPGAVESAAATPNAPALTLREIVTTPRFWLITIVLGLTVGSYLALIANLVPHATDIGIEAPRAAFLVSIAAVCAIPGKLAFGALADRIGTRVSFWIVIAFTAAAVCALLAFASYEGLVLACVMLGLAAGGLLPLWGLLIAQAFGQASFGRAAGAVNPAMMPITLLAAPFAGRVFDQTGTYRIAFITMLVALAAAAVVNAFLVPPRRARAA